MTPRQTRAQRLAMPLARDVVREVAVPHGGCVRPIQLRRTDTATGQVEQVLVPCGHTLATVCPSCAERNRTLRAAQCREGWHLDHEPVLQPDEPDDEQRVWIELRAQAQQDHDQAEEAGRDTAEDQAVIGELDELITRAGMRGNVLPSRPARRHRSTRRRQDTPDLPKRKISPRTIGKIYTASDGKTFRPSMFITLTCPSYGRVLPDGTPSDPATYDYTRAARDTLHFAALFDRFIQNLRRFLGYDTQYFAAIELQRRLAPHIHIAIRGTLSRTELRQVLAATYHQVWWPPTDTVRYDDANLPVWHEASGSYLDPATGELLPTWDEALDAIGEDDEPLHVARFGAKFDAQGVIAGSRDANRCIGYLTKYLTKHLGDCHQAQTSAPQAHADRLADALRYEPCSPACANWLRYGTQPKNPRPGPRPGQCRGKAHRREYLGYAGRRVLVSRKWSGKPLADHRGDRREWLLSTLGIPATEPRPVHLGARHPRRSRPYATRSADASCRRRPPALARRPHYGQSKSQRPASPESFGNREGRMSARSQRPTADRLLTVEMAADRLSASPRFVRRLIAERRIEFVKLGRHVRITEAALSEFIESGRVEPMTADRARPKTKGVA